MATKIDPSVYQPRELGIPCYSLRRLRSPLEQCPSGGPMTAEDTRRATWLKRNGWTLFTAISLIVALFGLGDVMAGGSTFASGEAVLFNRMTGTTWDDLRDAHTEG